MKVFNFKSLALLIMGGLVTVMLIIASCGGGEEEAQAKLDVNAAPIADAGADQNVATGVRVILDGSGSTDSDGDALSFSWSLTTPAGSVATLSDPAAVKPTFDIDLPGIYVAQLIVNDGTVVSVADTVTISTSNAPIADAGADQTALVGNTVTLDGSNSSDVDGDALSFSWSLTTPAGSVATLSDPAAVKPTFDIDLPGIYVAQLIVNDGTVVSAADTVTISTSNSAPVANAGPDQTALLGNTVTLDGSGSNDVDGDGLSFSWSLTPPAGSVATLSDPAAVKPTFDIDLHGTYVAQLIVNDGTVDSAADTVTVSTSNSAPVANAGPDQTTQVGNTVTLDGSSSSDVDGDALSFSWSLTPPAGSVATLSDPAAVKPAFDIDLHGIYVAQLIVNDGTVDSAADTVTVSTSNNAPVANAGPDQTTQVGETVTLDGSSSSDVDGDGLSFSWSLTAPAGSMAALSDPAAVNPTFDIDLPGTYVVQLIVNDGRVNSAPDTVNISTINSAPVADAGTDQDVLVNDTVILDGSGSSDADGDDLTFDWALTGVPTGSAAILSDAAAVNPDFVADLPGTYLAQLIVNDGNVNSAADTVTVIASSPVNNAPTANAGADQNIVVEGYAVTLDGSGSSDPDGDVLTYHWDLESKPAGSASSFSSTLEDPLFTPDIDGDYTISLVVNDGTVNSPPDTVVVTMTTAGQKKYDDACDYCHAAGSYDPIGESASDLYDDGEKLRTDLSAIKQMKNVPDITPQELLDLNAFLEDPSIAP